ncbi:MAG: TonB-dependent receptor plug domain-containing protein [Bacteroidia bacterium]
MKNLLLLVTAFLLSLGSAWAQTTVSGRVTDGDSNEPLEGATVQVKGTTVGIFTDAQGKYTLRVPDGAETLVFSFIGKASQEVAIGGRTSIDITMSSDELYLQEVVVTALGISRDKKALGYSVQDVKGDELTKARDGNVVNTLSGKIAGVQITSSSGNVGSSSRVVIRGNASISGNNQPLFVVNGIPIDNGTYHGDDGYGSVDYGNAAMDINPEDIESVSVLKGPNAAALYGSRAANGVIPITTKSGKGAQKRSGNHLFRQFWFLQSASSSRVSKRVWSGFWSAVLVCGRQLWRPE